MIQLNKYLGLMLGFLISISLIAALVVCQFLEEEGVVFFGLYTIILSIFLVTSFGATRNRKTHGVVIDSALWLGRFFLVLIILLPYKSESAWLYLNVVCIVLGAFSFYFNDRKEVQLMAINCIGVAVWAVLSAVGLMALLDK